MRSKKSSFHVVWPACFTNGRRLFFFTIGLLFFTEQITDLHRESVDHITIPSKQGKGDLKRVEEVRGRRIVVFFENRSAVVACAPVRLMMNVDSNFLPLLKFVFGVEIALMCGMLTALFADSVLRFIHARTFHPQVFDCWFESGSMPYAQLHYPFENKEKFEKNFPADFIAEGLDQVSTVSLLRVIGARCVEEVARSRLSQHNSPLVCGTYLRALDTVPQR